MGICHNMEKICMNCFLFMDTLFYFSFNGWYLSLQDKHCKGHSCHMEYSNHYLENLSSTYWPLLDSTHHFGTNRVLAFPPGH